MENIFVEFLPPWVETGLQPAFYDKESGTVLQQTARMYARVNMLIRMFNKLSKNTKETVEDYINRFNELYNYVHDYFDNLDVQEEINNKLDDMSESGELQEIIYNYLTTEGVLAYNTVADLASDNYLVVGSHVKTYGYKRKGDGVYNLYVVREAEEGETGDGYNTVLLGSGLIAEKLQSGKELVINVLATDNLQDYLSLSDKKTIILPKGVTYTITQRIFLNSDTILDLNDSTLYCNYIDDGETFIFLYGLTDTSTGYNGYKNITIRNGTISRACINMMHNKNVIIDGVEFINTVSRHCIQIAGSYGITVQRCIFNGTTANSLNASECINIDPCNYGGQPYMSEDSVMYDHTASKKILVTKNTFNISPDVNHKYATAVGSHGRDDEEYRQTYCDGLEISENNFGSPYVSAINMCDYKNVTVKDNYAEFNTSNVNSSSYFVKVRGAISNIYIHNNDSSNSSYFFYSGTDDNVDNVEIMNNKIVTNDTLSNPCFGFFFVTNSTIKDNEIHYKQTLFIIDSRYSEGSPVADSESNNIVIANNLIDKTNSTVNNAIRLRVCKNIYIDNNNFAYLTLAQPAGYAIAITNGLGQSNINFTNNRSKFTYNVIPSGSYQSCLTSKNNGGLIAITPQYDYFETGGSGSFSINSTFFRKMFIQAGASAYSNTIEITPWLINGDRFDETEKTWKIPVIKSDGTVGTIVFTITNDGANYEWSGDVAVRQVFGTD